METRAVGANEVDEVVGVKGGIGGRFRVEEDGGFLGELGQISGVAGLGLYRWE